MVGLALLAASAMAPLPNLVLLFCDDAGYGDFGFSGHPTIETPQLDRMAREGTRLTQFYSASPACTASRYAVLTGRYPGRSGLAWVLNPDSPRGIHPRETTIAELLKARGYATGIFGKWHLGYPNEKNLFAPERLPLAHGFDEYLGIPYSNDMLPPNHPPLRLLRGPSSKGDPVAGYETITDQLDQTTLASRLTDAAVSFVERHREGPFFLYVPFPEPHIPLHPGPAFQGKSRRGTYGDVIMEVDASVGRILESFRRLQLDRRTLVVFTSDNGPWVLRGLGGGSAGLFRDGKGSTWEGGVREPSIWWQPGTVPAASTREDVASTMDVFPTFARLAGASPPQKIDGADVWPLVRSGIPLPKRPYYYTGLNNEVFAVREGRWKLHRKTYSQLGLKYFEDPMPLLFDLEVDPSETKNAAASHPDVVAHLQELLAGFDARLKADGTYWDQ
ncbi:MAG: sulfatase [Fimbriimonadaceae bacterium]|nr:sulfatase [Fimbriimonadaceae bacterium]